MFIFVLGLGFIIIQHPWLFIYNVPLWQKKDFSQRVSYDIYSHTPDLQGCSLLHFRISYLYKITKDTIDAGEQFRDDGLDISASEVE